MATAVAATGQPAFVDVTEASGLWFQHNNGMAGQFHFHEIMGSGVGLIDYDGDGDLDVYLVQSAETRPGEGDRLFRNDGGTVDGGPGLRFTDVTVAAGLRPTGYGMGVTVADFDNDGHEDLYVTQRGPNLLWRNKGDGTFEDVADAFGVQDRRWSVPAVFFDFDRDGWLDLFVGNYLDYQPASAKKCFDQLSQGNYCPPWLFDPQGDSLFRNLGGDRGFQDITEEAGLDQPRGHTLGAGVADFDGDGWLDLYVANDTDANFLWRNLGNGRFEETALFEGAATDELGNGQSSMGIAVGDYDRDGDEDIFLTHLDPEMNTLYQRRARDFVDATTSSGLGPPSIGFTGFGAGWLDYDHDGNLDLVVANGAVLRLKEQYLAGDEFPLRQSNQLFRGNGVGFEDVSRHQGLPFTGLAVSRGAAFGDLDNDGDIDLLVTNNHGPAQVLENRLGQDRPWLGLELWDEELHRHAIGAWVGLLGDTASQWRRLAPAYSYVSSNDPRIHFGLGDDRPDRLVVRWPSGEWEEWPSPPAGRYSRILRGEGRGIDGNCVFHDCGPTIDYATRQRVSLLVESLVPAEFSDTAPEMRAQLQAQQDDLRRTLTGSPTPAETAAAVGELAEILHAYELFGWAVDHYKVARSLDQSQSRWPYLQGIALSRSGRGDEAMNAFRRALEIEPDHVPSKLRLGDLLLQSARPEAALAIFERLCPTPTRGDGLPLAPAGEEAPVAVRPCASEDAESESDPYRAFACVGLGRALLALQRPDAALASLNLARCSRPDAFTIDHLLATAYRRLGDRERMAEALERKGDGFLGFAEPIFSEVRRRARGAGPSLRLGVIYQYLERPDLAVEIYNQLLAETPDHDEARLGLAQAHLDQGNPEAAWAVLGEAPEALAEQTRTRLLAAKALRQMGRTHEAIRFLEQALSVRPGAFDVSLELANALLDAGRREDATRYAKRLHRDNPRDPGIEALLLRLDRD